MKVIHQGFKNHPKIKEKILKLSNILKECANNESNHLSDCGVYLDFISSEIKKVSKEVFEAHKIENKS